MKTLNLILFFAILVSSLSGCGPKGPDRDQLQNTKTEIHDLIDQWHVYAADANLEYYIGTMADSGVFIGTDATERWTSAEFNDFCKPYFDSATTWEFHPVQRFVYISEDGKSAWFDELLDTKLGLCRGSGVLRWENEGWKIEQYVLSPTIPNEMIKDVVAGKREADSLIIEKLTR